MPSPALVCQTPSAKGSPCQVWRGESRGAGEQERMDSREQESRDSRDSREQGFQGCPGAEVPMLTRQQ